MKYIIVVAYADSTQETHNVYAHDLKEACAIISINRKAKGQFDIISVNTFPL